MTDITQEIEEVNRHNGYRWVILFFMDVFNALVLIIFPLYVFIKIRFYHKRKDYFFTLIPALTAISAILSIPIIVKAYRGDKVVKYWKRGEGLINNLTFLVCTASKFLDTFVFATQYLKTSVVFPRLVTVTKIERL